MSHHVRVLTVAEQINNPSSVTLAQVTEAVYSHGVSFCWVGRDRIHLKGRDSCLPGVEHDDVNTRFTQLDGIFPSKESIARDLVIDEQHNDVWKLHDRIKRIQLYCTVGMQLNGNKSNTVNSVDCLPRH